MEEQLILKSNAWSSLAGNVHSDWSFSENNQHLFSLRRGALFFCNPLVDGLTDQKQALSTGDVSKLRQGSSMSKEEEMLLERMRASGGGVSSFSYHQPTDQLVVSAAGNIILMRVSSGSFELAPSSSSSARLHTCLSDDGKLLGFVRERNVYVSDTVTGKEVKVSDAQTPLQMAGEADFNHQEEFTVYRTYWISRQRTPEGRYVILYLQMDESDVHVFNIPMPGLLGNVDPFRYPLTGTRNSRVSLHVATVDMETGVVDRRQLVDALPDWTEYVPRAGIFPDGQNAWVTVLDRLQRRSALLQVPLFTLDKPKVLHEQQSEYWVNVSLDMNMPLHFFADGSILLASEEVEGFAHLYRLTTDGKLKALTSGDWQVDVKIRYTENKNHVWVDERNGVVFFLGRRDGPLETHLYCASLNGEDPTNPKRLTSPNMSHDVYMSPDRSHFVSISSNLQSPPRTLLHRVQWNGRQPEVIQLSELAHVGPDPATSAPFKFAPPKLFSIRNGGYELYGVTYYPPDYDATRRYPTLIYTYGGPHVQLVTNDYGLTLGPRSARFHMYASLGFVVSVLDNRGSLNRGLRFEAELRHRMGSVECDDQVCHVQHLVQQGITDANRVAVWGSSYGGYMVLMLLAKHAQHFKLGFSFAPVTMWEAYDTGYTERYMGLPKENPSGYRDSSVLTHAEGFPKEDGRLVLFTGLSDENVHACHTMMLIERLIQLNRPYELQVSPADRHGVSRAALHTSAKMLRHILKYL